jgi:hypothetical protein
MGKAAAIFCMGIKNTHHNEQNPLLFSVSLSDKLFSIAKMGRIIVITKKVKKDHIG